MQACTSYSLPVLDQPAILPENDENLESSTDQPETEPRDGDTNEDNIARVTITAKGEHSSHTTG